MSFATAYSTKKRMGKMHSSQSIDAGDYQTEDRALDMVGKIMESRKMSQGGMVANDTGTGQEADKLPNQFDDLVLRDDLEDTSGAGNEIGDASLDDESDDVVSAIMRDRKKK